MSKPEKETESTAVFFTKHYPEEVKSIFKVCTEEDSKIKKDREQLKKLSNIGWTK